MFSIKGPSNSHCCDGLTRRDLLRIGGLGAAGLMLPDLLRAQNAPVAGRRFGQAKRCILLFMSGGPPQQDTFDLKPDAPAEPRGEFKPIRTNVPGIEISEHLPMLARQADKYAIIRSVTHDSNIHTVGAHAMLTGNSYPKVASGEINASSTDFPHYGAVLSHLRKSDRRLPPFVSMPQKNTNTDGTVWPGQGGGFLGARYDPLQVTAEYEKHKQDPKDYENCRFRTPSLSLPEGVTPERFDARRRLLAALENETRGAERDAAAGLLDHYREKAFNLLGSTETQRAFDLEAEPAKVRDRYGRHLFGQSCLLARRLSAAGVPLVTVYWHPDGNTVAPSWDTHEKNYPNLKGHLMPPCDQGFSALLEDLHQSGMLDSTLVVWMGEFGRTPQVNAAGGRDHWGMCQSIVMAGGGVQGGQVYGKTDKIAAYPAENPVSPGDVGATIYWLLGVRPDAEIVDQTGRPHPLVRGEPITALL
jgi:hypothetical protein